MREVALRFRGLDARGRSMARTKRARASSPARGAARARARWWMGLRRVVRARGRRGNAREGDARAPMVACRCFDAAMTTRGD